MTVTAPTTRRTNHNFATPTRFDSYTRQATAGIGWFSLALGAAELVGPRAVSSLIGAKPNSPLLQTFGARELVSGIGILTSRRPATWLWGRVAGDIMDLAALGLMPLESDHDARTKRAAATAAVAGVTLLDAVLAVHHSTQAGSFTSRPRTPREQVTHFLSDMYSVEQQALSQLVKAPDIAGDPTLANDFRRHYTETEQQSHMVRNRLAALGGSPSKIKDAVMRLGGKGFLAFARTMPETPGRLVVHSYAYEAMEYAGYKMLIRFAAEAGDMETVDLADIIRDEEQEMMHRLERGFDAAEHVTHAALSQEDLAAHLQTHLNEVHAFESQAIELLEKSRDNTRSPSLGATYDKLLQKSRHHADRIEQMLAVCDSRPSTVKDSAMALGGLNWFLFFQAQRDMAAKLAAFVYAVIHLQIGGLELLARTANRLTDNAIQSTCCEIISEKRNMAADLEGSFPAAARSALM